MDLAQEFEGDLSDDRRDMRFGRLGAHGIRLAYILPPRGIGIGVGDLLSSERCGSTPSLSLAWLAFLDEALQEPVSRNIMTGSRGMRTISTIYTGDGRGPR